jgi:hypothetical protein
MYEQSNKKSKSNLAIKNDDEVVYESAWSDNTEGVFHFECPYINGIPVTTSSINKTYNYIKTLLSRFDISGNENTILHDFELYDQKNFDPETQDLKSFESEISDPYSFSYPNAVVNNNETYIEYLGDMEKQLSDKWGGMPLLYSFLGRLGRQFIGFRLDRSGTTLKTVHYGKDEVPLPRTPEEQKDEPFISVDILNYFDKKFPGGYNEGLKDFFMKTSYLKTLKKIGIDENTSDFILKEKLKKFEIKGNEKYLTKTKEWTLSKDEEIIFTHKGISLTYNMKDDPIPKYKSSNIFSDKYDINNFDNSSMSPDFNRSKVEEFFHKIKRSNGRILMVGYAIAGFGDLVNFQMLYQNLIKLNPDLESRIDAYAHFFRYSINNETLDKLLDKRIKVITHNNANRQWDPNYSYKILADVISDRDPPEFEIQYNVGSVFQSDLSDDHVLKVGEIGGMAGVTKVEDAFFTGLSRGGIGFGVPHHDNDDVDHNVLGVAKSLYMTLKGIDFENNDTQALVKDNFALMMARENSQIINQRPFYDISDVFEGSNLSVGKRALATILKDMILHGGIDEPIILSTGKVDALEKQASEIGMRIIDKKITVEDIKILEIVVDGVKGYVAQGFFSNKLINTVMKYTKVPVVFSGEGSMNEGLSYNAKGFMVPFYDYQITTIIESSGIDAKEDLQKSKIAVKNVPTDKNHIKIEMTEGNINLIKEFDLLKLKIGGQPPQLYFVTEKVGCNFVMKKLDRTELTIDVEKSLSFSDDSKEFSGVIYRLHGWAKEWLRMIYCRDIESIDTNLMGEQVTSLNVLPSWFDLSKGKSDIKTTTL